MESVNTYILASVPNPIGGLTHIGTKNKSQYWEHLENLLDTDSAFLLT